MRRLADVMTRWRALPTALIAVVLAIAVVPAPGGESGLRWPSIALAVVVLAVGALIAVNLFGHDPEAEQIATWLTDDELAQALLTRWLRRSRYYRFLGGAVGLVLGFTAMSIADQGGLFVFGGLAGVALGGALAEIHVLRARRAGPALAELSARRLGDYVGAGLLRISFGVAALASFVSLLALFIGDDPGAGLRRSLPALLIVGAVVALQHQVAVRRRPALSPRLREADDLLRSLAATRGFAPPALALTLALCASAVGTLHSSGVVAAVSAVLWLTSIAWYTSNRRLGLDGALRQTQAAQPASAS